MIRPITVICWILALGAGLYLYRAKHEVELMDKHIEKIAKQTGDLRAESRRLLDDWIRLGEPEQLHKYSDEYLGLKTIAPTQFARLSDLPSRLPATRTDPKPEEQPDAVAQTSEDQTGASAAAPGVLASGAQPSTAASANEMSDADEDLPLPPIPPVVPVVASVAAPVVAPPLQARPVTPRQVASQTEPRHEAAGLGAGQGNEPGAGNPAWPARGLPPSQAQGPRNGQGLPPLQAQTVAVAPAQGQAQGPGQPTIQGTSHWPGQSREYGQAAGQPPGSPTYRPAETRAAEIRPNEPPRAPGAPTQYGQALPWLPQAGQQQGGQPPVAQPPPWQRQPAQRQVQAQPQPRAGGNAAGGQWPSQGPQQGQTQVSQQGPAPGGSLLGRSHGPVPLPLPAPTPVSATWQGPVDSGR